MRAAGGGLIANQSVGRADRRGGARNAATISPGDHAPDRPADPSADWHRAALHHAADAIVVADLAGRIQYANPLFVRDAGVESDCLIGQVASWLAVADTPAAAATRALWSAIRRGRVWRGQLMTCRPDGSLAHAEATAAPVRDEAGSVVGVVAVMRDASSQRALDARVDVSRLERTALVAALGTMRSGDAPGTTSAAILLALLGFYEFRSVSIFGFEPDGGIIPLATLDRAGKPLVLAGILPASRCAYLRERASKGPWIENWQPAPDHPYLDAAVELGAGVLAYVPIRSEDIVLGLLIVSTETGAELELAERLPALVECAAVAGALLGAQVRSRNVRTLGEARIRAIIADRAFLPVFQPIVELAGRTVVGYEALSRFADGSRPEEVFAAAARCGLAIELEAATLEAALDSSVPLPGSAWLNLNVSAELVLSGHLASILHRRGGQIVLELTEHVEVTDYSALRAALERLGPTVRLAVDDAGAGFASLRHILELRPDYVKLDRGIVHGVDGDPARQALIAGMVHFAAKTRAVVIAEGVETEGEARQLRQLGVALGQGFRLGRPALARRIAAPLGQAALTASHAPVQEIGTAPVGSAARDTINQAINIGEILAAALREAGVATVADLRAIGAVSAWERLQQTRPRLATAATLLQLEGATRGRRVTQLPPAERERLRLFVRLHGRAASGD